MKSSKASRSKGPKPTDEPPPFFGTWNRIYLVVVVYTCVMIVALYLITVLLNRS